MHGDGVITSEIGFIDIRVFAHATEDTDKVQTAVRNLLPEELAANPYFPKNKLNGASWKPHHPFYSQTNRQKNPSSST